MKIDKYYAAEVRVVRELNTEEYLEFMFLQWYYGHMQAYVNGISFEHEKYDTFQEWIIDYYEHPRWGSNFKLKAPKSYREAAKNKIYASQGSRAGINHRG